jgi:hypothetical protein
MHAMGENFFKFCQCYGITPRVHYAVASRKNNYSLVKGMISFDQGGDRGGEWKKVVV